MFARMENGLVAAVYDGSSSVVIDGFAIKYRHLETWHRLPAQNFELVARGLVKVKNNAPPTFDAARERLDRVLCRVGDAAARNTWRKVTRPRADAVVEIRARAAMLFRDKGDDLGVNNTDWLAYRTALRQWAQELLQAYDLGSSINIQSGAIGGTGGWPV